MKIFIQVVFFILFATNNEAARILAVFPVPSISHQVVFRPLTQELARRGHEVVIITPDPAFEKGKAPANITEIDLHELLYTTWRKEFMSSPRGSEAGLIEQLYLILDTFVVVADKLLQDEAVKRLINNKKESFDLLLIEDCVKPALIFSNIYKVPVVQVSSFGAFPNGFEEFGAPFHPFLYSGVLRRKNYNLTLWDKVLELHRLYLVQKMLDSYYKKSDLMLKKHFPDVPKVDELQKNVSMLLLNTYQVYDGIRPVPPAIVFMGGIHQNPVMELPADLKSFLDSSKHGVIYLSFGTNVNPSQLPPEKIQIFVKVFSQLPYDVLWKWDKDELPGRTENLKILKWLPQSDLLRHPKLKLFITQGGLQSTDEAITAGVPMIGIPMLSDQWYNVEKYVHHKIGMQLDFVTLTEKDLSDTINEVIGDGTYHRNVMNLRDLMADQPQGPLERAVWWTEHVLRHGGARHLRAPAAYMPLTQYFELELVLTLFGFLMCAISMFLLIIYILYKYITAYYIVSDQKIKRN